MILGWYHDLSGVGDPTDIMSLSDEGVFIGTGPGEYWRGGRVVRAALRAQAEVFSSIRVTPGDVQAYEEGAVGWASDQCHFVLPNGLVLSARFTWVFHREGDQWKMIQAHCSHEVGNETWGVELDLSMDAIASYVEQHRPDLTDLTKPEGTVTVVFTDIVSSTAMNEALGDDRFLPLLLAHNEIVRSRTSAAGGTVVKSLGDGFMLAFSSAHRGVECAVAIQEEIASLKDRLDVRMGIHTGEPVRYADDFYGRDVTYAARLGAVARGGEILTSALVKSLVEPSGSFKFGAPREMELKGFDGLQPVFEVVWSERGNSTRGASRTRRRGE